jgi:hypothetical protein
VGRHCCHQQLIHRALGRLEEIGRFLGVEPAPTSRDHELMVERRAEAEKPLDGLAQREPQSSGDFPIVGGGLGGLIQMVGGNVRLGRVEILKEANGQEVAPLAEEKPLFVRQGKDPGQLRGDFATRMPIRPGDPARGEAGAGDRRAARPIGR